MFVEKQRKQPDMRADIEDAVAILDVDPLRQVRPFFEDFSIHIAGVVAVLTRDQQSIGQCFGQGFCGRSVSSS